MREDFILIAHQLIDMNTSGLIHGPITFAPAGIAPFTANLWPCSSAARGSRVQRIRLLHAVSSTSGLPATPRRVHAVVVVT